MNVFRQEEAIQRTARRFQRLTVAQYHQRFETARVQMNESLLMKVTPRNND